MTRRALVTGASAGLAAGIAASLPADGFDVVAITYRNTLPHATVAAVEAAGARAIAERVDFLAGEAEIEAALQRLGEQYGPFDSLIHAVGPIVVKRFERLTMADYGEMFDGNVRSSVLATRAVLPSMRAAKFGRIVFFGSLGAQDTRPFRGLSLYQAAKSAVVAFARTLAVEEARHGITVNVVSPGDIREKKIARTEALLREGRNPRGRPGSFDDVAGAVRFFLSHERDFVTGAVLDVNGGLTQADERNEPAP